MTSDCVAGWGREGGRRIVTFDPKFSSLSMSWLVWHLISYLWAEIMKINYELISNSIPGEPAGKLLFGLGLISLLIVHCLWQIELSRSHYTLAAEQPWKRSRRQGETNIGWSSKKPISSLTSMLTFQQLSHILVWTDWINTGRWERKLKFLFQLK